MEIRRTLRVVLKLVTCTVGGVVSWLALSVFAPTVYESAIEGAVPVKSWHCAVFGLVAGIGWAVGYKTKWGNIIAAALLGGSISIGFQLLGHAEVSWLAYVALSLLIAVVFWFL